MKLKDLTPKGQKALNEVDYSTIRLKSNIDQKWSHITDMTRDLQQWMSASHAASGPEVLDDLQDALEGLLDHVKDLSDHDRY